jgi:hypothetical protein
MREQIIILLITRHGLHESLFRELNSGHKKTRTLEARVF